MLMAFKFKELQGDLGEALGAFTAGKEMVLFQEINDAYQIWLEADYLYIEKLKVNIYCGVYKSYDFDENSYILENDLHIFFDADKGEFLYYEYGSSLEVCVINFIRELELKIRNVENLKCFYAFDDGKFLKEKVLKNTYQK